MGLFSPSAPVEPERKKRRISSPTSRSAEAKNALRRSDATSLTSGGVDAAARAAGGGEPALTAAGMKVRHTDADKMRRLIQPWHARSFSYYDTLGEIKYAAQFYARMLAPLRLYAAEINDDDEIVPTDNEKAKAALSRIQDPGGGRTGLLSQYGRLMFLTGEAILLCSADPDTEIEQWEMLSTDELRIMPGVMMRYKAPSILAEEYREPDDDDFEPLDADTAIPYRLWRKHPRYSWLSDSTMQGVLDLCEELLLLTQAVRARARSRLAGSGILFIDDRISPAPDEPVGDEDPEEDVFLSELIEGVTKPIVDEGAASAVAPILIRVPMGDQGSIRDMVYHLQIVDPTQLYPETGLRTECIHRIALGLDMPAEILEGLGDSNHWTSWQIDEQTWKGHGQPIAQALVDDLTASFFRPQLKQDGVDNWQRFVIAYDPAKVINHPDRSRDAKELFTLGELSGEGLRDACGVDEKYQPSHKERLWWLGAKIRDGSLAIYGEPSVKPGGVMTAPDELLSDQGTTGSPPSGGTAADVNPGAPATAKNDQVPGDAPSPVSASGNGHSASAAQIMGACQFALLRAREAAGSRIRSRARRDRDLFDALEGVRSTQVAATLGAEKVRELGCPAERELVAGARDLILDSLRVQGIRDEDVAMLIADSVERHAASTLYEMSPPALPSQFVNYLSGLRV